MACNITNLHYRLKNDYQAIHYLQKNEEGYMDAAPQNILNGWKNCSCHLLNILALIKFDWNSSKFKNDIEKLKRLSRQVLLKFRRNATEDIETNIWNP